MAETRKPKPAISRKQREFTQLTKKIQQERERLIDAEQRLEQFRQRLLESLQPVHTRLREAQWQLALGIDKWLDAKERGARLSRRDRDNLESVIATLIDDLLQASQGDDLALTELHEKYGRKFKRPESKADIAAAEAMMSAVYGADVVAGHAAQSIDELHDHVQSRLEELERAALQAEQERQAARRSKRSGPTRSELADARRQEAAQQATASVRDIYRKLVSSLHPDREPDATERERKTALLQRANQAYESGDLMALFALQIEIAQIDVSHLANLPEERIKPYILMLREQLRALQRRLDVCEDAFEDLFEAPHAFVDDHWIERSIKRQVRDAKAVLATIQQDLRSINTPTQRRAFLDSLADSDLGEPDDSDVYVFSEMLEAFAPPPSPSRKSKDKKAQRRGK